MDENEVGIVEVTDAADVIDSAWGDDDYSPTPSTETTDTEVETDQVETDAEVVDETAESEAPETTESNAETNADEYLELKHMDDPVRKVTKEEAKELAQKGLDYDRIRGKLDSITQENAQLKAYKDFLEEIRGDFASIEDLMADTKAVMYIDAEKKKGNTITKASALEHVKKEMESKPLPKAEEPKPSQESINEAVKRDSFTRFAEAYPNVNAKDIPKEVWDDVEKTNSLIASYSMWQLKQKNAELEAIKLEEKNRMRSAGSMKSKGTSSETLIDKYWGNDDW